jgi:hypothetical protein
MSKNPLTTDDPLTEALTHIPVDGDIDEGGHTTTDLRLMTGMALPQLMDKLHKLDREGRLESKRVKRRAVDGLMRWFTVYRLREPKKE